LRSSSIVFGRGFSTLDADTIYRQLAVFINNEITIPTQLHLRNLTTPAAQLLPSAKAKAIVALRTDLFPCNSHEFNSQSIKNE
jgi:hypothetical protein